MVIESETEEVHEARRTALELLFSDHVGDCLAPCHRLCPLHLNISAVNRHIEAGRAREAHAIVRATLPLAGVLGRLCHHPCEQGCRRGNWDSPAAIRDMERYVTDEFRDEPETQLPARQPDSGRRVVVMGAGPTGLAAAFHLRRCGHVVTVVDRNAQPGGSLRRVAEAELPREILDSEIGILARMGVEFRNGIELGNHVTIEGLLLGHDAVLVATGTPDSGDAERFGLSMAGAFLKANPNTCQAERMKVFVAGAAAKTIKQVVRAMAEGHAAGEAVDQFLAGRPIVRREKAFSSMMGRLDPAELKLFLQSASTAPRVQCDRCARIQPKEAVAEAARCLHCDCTSSGNCALQHYGQAYGVEASRFRAERRRYEQRKRPGGVVFEPGKCILCGICVKLAEMAREPLGLAFVGRGFDIRIRAPFNHDFSDGLRTVAEECVRCCPTGALTLPCDPATGAAAPA
jgi:ferredoxin